MIIEDDTIAAVATAPGVGGIGIIRISGPTAVGIVQALFRTPGVTPSDRHRLTGNEFPCFSHRSVHYGYLVDPDGFQVIDEVLVLFMGRPNSYTREDVIEIQSHAGSAVLQKILSLVVSQGARLADPGEFTRRAFLNGRIDLTQAEAVVDLIKAKTDQARALATRQLTGGLRQEIGRIRSELENAASHLEAAIEFPDDLDDAPMDRNTFLVRAKNAANEIGRLLRSHRDNHIYRDGIQVSVVGRPNVGKSSLMNALLKRERAIVTELPGTTRDVVMDTFQANGIPIQIADTAGMRSSDDLIERIGMRKTEESIAAAQLVLFVLDCIDPDHPEDEAIYHKIGDKKIILVLNKSDLVDIPPKTPQWLRDPLPTVSVSAKQHFNIEGLKTRIVAAVVGGESFQPTDGIVPNLRQKETLQAAQQEVMNAISASDENRSEEFIVFHLQSAMNSLGTITGETYREDLLDTIFERFCIGK
jgi:tRNA modification GTPase